VCACDTFTLCPSCEGSPADPGYIDREEAEAYTVVELPTIEASYER
jgi:hypothetical protein